MRLHPRAASLLPLLLLVLLPPVHGEAALEAGPRLLCAPSPTRVTSFAKQGSQIPSLAAMGSRLFFASYDPLTGTQLQKAEVVNGVVEHAPLRSWPGTVSLARLTVAGSLLYFVANEGVRTVLWSSDGTSTTQLATFENSSLVDGTGFAVLGSTLFFRASTTNEGAELWKSDGTVLGTQLVKDINPRGGDSYPLELTVLNGALYFSAYEPVAGYELWTSDGVPNGPGTHRVADIRLGSADSFPSSLRVMNGRLFFTATTGGQAELWTSDGTDAQVAVKDALGPNHTPLEELTVMGNVLFFHMDDQRGNGDELWRTDGTENGTRIVRQLQEGPGSSAPQTLVVVGDTLFFMASDARVGRELWKTDGTDAGTVLVNDFVQGSSNPPGDEVAAAGLGALLLSINDGAAGKELWKVNGAGAERLTDIDPLGGSSNPRGMTLTSDRLYFVATYPGEGEELVALPLNAVDCVSPQVVCPSNLSVEAIGPRGATVRIPPPRELRDDSLTPLTVTYDPGPEPLFGVGTTPVKIFVEDAARNRVECPLTVSVRDTTPPALVCPARLTQEASGPGGTSVSFPVKALDAVTPMPNLEFTPPSGSLFPLGQEREVVARATDSQSNFSECRFKVLVQDTVPPRLVCPQSVVRVATSAEPVAITYPAPQVEDAVGVQQVTPSHASGSLFPVGETAVTLTAVDAAGNSSQCAFTVYNQDVIAPAITCPGPQQVVATQEAGAQVPFPEATATDELGPPTVLYSQEPGSLFPVGETVVTATARDFGGNEVSCSFTVTVLEREGCGCQSGAAGAVAFWWMLALMPLWARRRAARMAR